MNHKQKTRLASFISIYPPCFGIIFFRDTAVMAPLVGVAVVNLIWMMSLYIKGDPEAKRQREKELQRGKTRELEKDLGYEPLNLHELDPIFDEIEKEKPHE